MENVFFVLAQAETGQAQGGGSSMLIFLVLMFAAMYFLMIAPQRKRQKKHQQMIADLKTGDAIVTIGGAIGTITNVKEKSFVIRLGDNVKVEFIKSAIQDKVPAKDEAPIKEIESK